MPVQQRARRDADKQARAQAILDAAQFLMIERPFVALTMAEVAAQAGLAKATVFLYFPTKEALGLAVVERLLEQWFAAIDAELAALPSPATPAAVAELIASSVTDRGNLVQLLAILGSILERNIAAATARRFKRRLLASATATGERLERALPFLQPGDGLRVVLLIHALAVGLYQMAEPAPIIRELQAAPELAALRVEFVPELRAAVHTHLEGLRVLRGG